MGFFHRFLKINAGQQYKYESLHAGYEHPKSHERNGYDPGENKCTECQHHHVIGMVYLCRLADDSDATDFDKLGHFDPESDDATGVEAMEWIPLEKIEGIEIMPPHLRKLLMKDFPPPPGRGIEFWPED